MAALGVAGVMKGKTKMGLGLRKRVTKKRKIKKGRGITFNAGVKKAKEQLRKHNPKNINSAIRIAKKASKNINKTSRIPRIIKVPTTGGFLPLIPLLAGKLNN